MSSAYKNLDKGDFLLIKLCIDNNMIYEIDDELLKYSKQTFEVYLSRNTYIILEEVDIFNYIIPLYFYNTKIHNGFVVARFEGLNPNDNTKLLANFVKYDRGDEAANMAFSKAMPEIDKKFSEIVLNFKAIEDEREMREIIVDINRILNFKDTTE